MASERGREGDSPSSRLSGDHDLNWPDVFRLPTPRAFGDAELNRLAFLQALESTRLDGGKVHKHVLSVLAADKAIAFGIVKPLNCSLFHRNVLMFLF